jgi:hypothetical protein
MKKYAWLLVLAVMATACGGDDVIGADDPPVRLSGTMKLVADSLTVTLRVANLSDTTQVVEWTECASYHPTHLALFRDVGLQQQAWEQPIGSSCPSAVEGEMLLAKEASGPIRGFGVAIADMLNNVAPGTYYIGIKPLGLTVRRVGASYAAPVRATIPVGPITLTP